MARPFRHTLILAGAALGTALAAMGGWRYARASAPLNGPIIVISIDALRADHLPVYGYRRVKTRAIDGLAADGVVFEHAYSHAPLTLPAHAAMLSGRLPFENGVRDNVGFVVKPGERLLPQMLRERGYATAGIVSSHLLGKETGISQGFDFFDDDTSFEATGLALADAQRDGNESEQVAEHWLDTVGTSRAFLFLHFHELHERYAPPDRFAASSAYDGEIAHTDEIVGRLVRYLKSHQLYDRSTIVLLSDHGEGLGDHGEHGHGLFVYDETVHVPFIVKQEGNVNAGRRVPDRVQHVDLVPTILDLVKAPIPGALRGQSLKPLLDGTGHLPERGIYAESLYGRYRFGWSALTSITDGRYRYIKAPQEELYDLERDPHERQNILLASGAPAAPPHQSASAGAAAAPALRSTAGDERVRKLRSALEAATAGALTSPPVALTPETRERIRALGYRDSSTGDAPADPKDRREALDTYRKAVDLAVDRKWIPAIALLQRLLHADPEMADGWRELAALASTIDRLDLTVDAYKHIIGLRPDDPGAYLGMSDALLQLRKFDDAREHAALAARVATDQDVPSRTAAHVLLAQIALVRHDADDARQEAELVRQLDGGVPMPSYVKGRLLYDEGDYDDALPHFEEALAALKQSGGAEIAELHFYAADTLMKLDRYPEAETELAEELRHFPKHSRARGALAALYQTTGRDDEAARTVSDLTRINPTPDSYALAARLWKSFGKSRQAGVVRAEAQRAFAGRSSVTLPPRG